MSWRLLARVPVLGGSGPLPEAKWTRVLRPGHCFRLLADKSHPAPSESPGTSSLIQIRKEKIMRSLILAFFELISCAAQATTASEQMKRLVQQHGEEVVVAPNFRPATVRHLVLFRYKDSVTYPQRAEIKERFLALARDCRRNGDPYVVSIETGGQNSGEGADLELQQAFVVTFKSEGDRNYYVGKVIVQKDGNYDPSHDAFKKFVGPFLRENGGVVVFDYDVEASTKR
jgi:hypothetical protein